MQNLIKYFQNVLKSFTEPQTVIVWNKNIPEEERQRIMAKRQVSPSPSAFEQATNQGQLPPEAIKLVPVSQKETQKIMNSGSPSRDYTDYLTKGLRAYAEGQAGGTRLPIEKYIPQFNEAAQKYPIFEKYPWLPAAISILESSGGLNVTRENNPLNWGARLQKRGEYSPQSWEQSIDDALTAIGGDYGARPAGTSRARNADYYQQFRDTGDLKNFATTWEPANPSYYEHLLDMQRLFEQQR